MPVASSVADYQLLIAFNDFLTGVFTLDSALDGPDVLADFNVFGGDLADVSIDLDGSQPVVITMGADSLIGSLQASSVTFNLSRPDDPSYWNPNNPASPLNEVDPGFTVMRPVKYQATQDGTTYGVFTGFIRRPTWRSDTRTCEIYCEDLLLWGSRVYPVIASTGPTTTGAVIDMLWDAVGYIGERSTAVGDPLDDFSADGSLNVPQIIATLLEAERGTVYINGDGVPVYEDRAAARSREASATIIVTEQTAVIESGKDVDLVFTRANVNGFTSAADEAVERRVGRGDLPEISNTYVVNSQLLADDLVYAGVNGQPPITLTVFNIDADTLTLILTSPLLSVFAIDDEFGGTTGEGIVQRIVHSISTGQHTAEYLLAQRATREFSLDSELDGPDVFRY